MADIVVTRITAGDRERWTELWRGYLDFYETRLPSEIYDHTWQRLFASESPVRGLGARLGAETAPLIGIVHYLFHAHAWMMCEVCYLQDLFVDATIRRQGCGAKLIEAVAAIARERGCTRLYWTTKEDNTTARSPTTGLPASTASSVMTTLYRVAWKTAHSVAAGCQPI